MTCAWCSAPLVDADGQPAWDIFGGTLTFVCLGGCTPGVVRRVHVPRPQRIRHRMLARAGRRADR